MRAILDTNVLLSGFLWRQAPHTLLEHVRRGALTLVTSPALLDELAEVLSRSKFDTILVRSHTSRQRTLDELQRLAEMVEPSPLPQPACRDPDDDEVLAAALAGQVDLIVSGDNDLLGLKQYRNIPILSPADALGFIEANP